MSDLDDLRDAMRVFTSQRAWEQFHDPKSLVLALTGEVGELAELFQWLPADEASALAQEPGLARRAGEELADVLLYLIRLSDVLGIDLRAVADAKLSAARDRFPAAEVRGAAPAPKGL